MRTGLRSVALLTTASLLFSSFARAANPPGAPKAGGRAQPAQATDEARSDAQKRLDEGLDRYAKGDFEGARLAFAQAYAVLTSIDLLYNLTRSEVKSGHPLEALVHIHQMLRDPKATTDDRAKAERLLEEANRVTGHIAVEAPEGAEIVLDHVPSGEAPVSEAYDVVPGQHVIEARANGGSRKIVVVAPAGLMVRARFALEAGRAPTVSAPVPVMTALPPAPPPSEPPPPPATKEPSRPPQPVESAPHAQGVNARIVVPIVIGALGVVGLRGRNRDGRRVARAAIERDELPRRTRPASARTNRARRAQTYHGDTQLAAAGHERLARDARWRRACWRRRRS